MRRHLLARGDRRLALVGAVTVRPIFAWYDLWVGIFWDRKSRKLYILPVPCIGLVVTFNP